MSYLQRLTLISAILLCVVSGTVYGQQENAADSFQLKDNDIAKQDTPIQEFHFESGQTRTLTVSFDVPKAFLENPDLVTVKPNSPKQLTLTAKKPGITNLNLWDSNQTVYVFKIVITGKLSKLHELYAEQFPNAEISLKKLSNSLLISGMVNDREQISQIEAIGREYFPRIVTNINVRKTQPKEIVLKTRLLEVSRNELRMAGLAWVPFAGASTDSEMKYKRVSPDDILNTYLTKLDEKDVGSVINYPTLRTLTGRQVQFDSGGQLPAVESVAGEKTIRFRQIGFQMTMRPNILDDGSLQLELKPTMHQMDEASGLKKGGVTIPGIRSGTIDTVLRLQPGQFIAIHGIPGVRYLSKKESLPFLSDLPLIGSQFYRTKRIADRVERIILIHAEWGESTLDDAKLESDVAAN